MFLSGSFGILSEESKMEEDKRRRKYCVTGATGFIGSWLVKTLLQDGYTVHATLRHPAKSLYLLSVWPHNERLKLFQADLNEEGSFDEAIKGCDGVFHVAASMQFDINREDEDIEKYVQSNIIDPSIKGTLNVLKSCLKSKSVKRVVFTSSISTLTAKDRNGEWRHIVDESSQTPTDCVWKMKVYVLSKLLSEEAAYKFAYENGIDIVSVITSTVGGPFLTSHVPSSIRVLLSPITDEAELFKTLSTVNERMGSIGLVHVEDICRAHIFLMEHVKAKGQFICCEQSCVMSNLLQNLCTEYPSFNFQRYTNDEQIAVPCEISSKKLRDLGFEFKYGIQDIIHQTISCCIDYGFLSPT